MNIQAPNSLLRAFVSVCAALVAISICIHQHHVHLVLWDADTYGDLLRHKCGRLVLLCVSWMAFELGAAFLPLHKAMREQRA